MATEISSAASAVPSASRGASASGGNQIAGNFQDFLTLLTTQLKHQSPLDPLDTNQFTQQLVQFAGVEQQLRGNDTLSSILSATKSATAANAAAYIGLKVTADGSTASLVDGAATWTINPAKAAAKATMTIKDKDDKVVVTRQTTLKAGTQTYAWDGKDTAGNAQPAGDYTLSIAALDASGQPVTISTELAGQVTAVDVSGAGPVLTVGSSQIPLSRIRTIAYQ